MAMRYCLLHLIRQSGYLKSFVRLLNLDNSGNSLPAFPFETHVSVSRMMGKRSEPGALQKTRANILGTWFWLYSMGALNKCKPEFFSKLLENRICDIGFWFWECWGDVRGGKLSPVICRGVSSFLYHCPSWDPSRSHSWKGPLDKRSGRLSEKYSRKHYYEFKNNIKNPLKQVKIRTYWVVYNTIPLSVSSPLLEVFFSYCLTFRPPHVSSDFGGCPSPLKKGRLHLPAHNSFFYC